MFIKTSNQERLKLGFGTYECNWGLHIAGLYETEQERDSILMGYLKEGALSKDLQLYAPAERSISDFHEKFSHQCKHCGEYSKDKNLFQLYSIKNLYYPNGYFSPNAMDVGLNNFYEKSQKNGKRNIRATAEMVWALKTIPGKEHLFAYESRLNYFIPKKPWISICLYNTIKFSGSMIMNVLQTHPYTISKGVITENPYYQSPDKWLAENAPEFLQR